MATNYVAYFQRTENINLLVFNTHRFLLSITTTNSGIPGNLPRIKALIRGFFKIAMDGIMMPTYKYKKHEPKNINTVES